MSVLKLVSLSLFLLLFAAVLWAERRLARHD